MRSTHHQLSLGSLDVWVDKREAQTLTERRVVLWRHALLEADRVYAMRASASRRADDGLRVPGGSKSVDRRVWSGSTRPQRVKSRNATSSARVSELRDSA